MASKALLRTAGWFFALLLFLEQFCIPAGAVSRTNLLRTTLNPDAYSLFEINGYTVTARGKYSDDRLAKISISAGDIGSMNFSSHADGSYEAEFTVSSVSDSSVLALKFNSGVTISYPLYSDENGLYFPQNGLAEENRLVLEKIHDAPKLAAGYYLTASGEAEKIAEVQRQIKQISDSVADGLESDYDKARALAEYVAAHVSYDVDARNESVTEETVSIEHTLKYGRTVCIGFANLYCALLQAQGIDAVNIKGGSTGGGVTYATLTDGIQNHEFTAFFCEAQNRWVWVDSCWDGSGIYQNGEFLGNIQHEKYFDITDEALSFDHRADYAERRDFFNAQAAEQPKETEQTEVTTTAAETTVPESVPETTTIAALTEQTAGSTENSTKNEKTESETPLIITIVLLSAGIAALAIFIFHGRKTKNGSNRTRKRKKD